MEVGFQDDEIEEVLPNPLALVLLKSAQAGTDQRQPVAGGPATCFQVLQIRRSQRIGDGLEANLFGEMVEIPSGLFFARQLQLSRQLAPQVTAQRKGLCQTEPVSQSLLGLLQIAPAQLLRAGFEIVPSILIAVKDLDQGAAA